MYKEVVEILRRIRTPKQTMPEPDPIASWMQEQYETSLKSCVESLHKGKKVIIIDDGRGFELACDAKRKFILDYSKQLAEKIIISEGGSTDGFKRINIEIK